ncbi:MAG: S-layer homology domain-containing protein, partial [Clostridia bacterium]|nr:S-layer homology domain-containing protein [Clostridia bacterium]
MNLRKALASLLALLMLVPVCVTGITAAETELPFTDVKAEDWFYDPVDYVYSNGLMNGVGGALFGPGMSLTRSMVVTVLYRNNGSPETEFESYFSDVSDGQFYSLAVVWAKENGIVTSTGTDDFGEDLFSPDRDITRQELATMFKRYAEFRYVKADGRADISAFPDHGNVAASWALEAVQWAVHEGLINGKGNGIDIKLCPTDKASRAEFAAIIKRFNEADFEYKSVYNSPTPISQYTEPDYPKVEDADIYVAVDGSDTVGDGSFDNPYATFAKAVEAVRVLKENATDEIVVAFKEGNYGGFNITLKEADSGSESVPIRYCAYGDGDVVFSGGAQIDLDEFLPIDESDYGFFPEANRGKIYKADLSDKKYNGSITKDSWLYSDDGRLSQARFPNKAGDTDQYNSFGT